MIYNSLAEIFDAMGETRARLHHRLDGIESERSALRSSSDTWSVAEIAEHLAIFEERMSKLFNIMLTKAEAEGLQRGEDRAFRPVSLEHIAERSSREKYTAPESVRPTGAPPVADSLARLRGAREKIQALRARLEEFDLSGLTYPHPAFGPLDLYQWLALIGHHEDRHLRQIEAIMASHEPSAAKQQGAADKQ